MAKKKKKEIVMVDMSARLNIKVIESTEEESIQLQKELEEMELSIQRKMQRYECEIRELFMSSWDDDIVSSRKRDSDYFISTYENIYKNCNNDHIKNRLKKISLLISENE